MLSNISEQLINQQNTNLMNLLEQARPRSKEEKVSVPSMERKPKALFLIGAGLGIIGTLLADRIFGTDSANEIKKLNEDLGKHNKLIKLTNERVDILSKNISQTNDVMKQILDKLVQHDSNQDIHYALLWNLDQLVSLNIEIANTFRLGELTITLLDRGILNPELIQLSSLKAIIDEGLKLFPTLTFPLEVSRYQLDHVTKLLKVQRLGRHQYIIIIPLTSVRKYKIFKLIAHPLQIDKESLVLPKIQNLILTDKNDTYIVTSQENVYSISASQHILLEIEAIYRQTLLTCEWAVFKERTADIIRLCNFEKTGEINNTYVVETGTSRLVYFAIETDVDINCPGRHTTTKLTGLHNISLACDVTTNQVHWPSKQTATIDVLTNDTNSFYSTELHVATINKSSDVHTSLRELINKLPKPNSTFTIDFDYYELTRDQLHTYTIFSQSFLTVIVIINSMILGFLCFKWKQSDKSNIILATDRLGRATDSLTTGRDRFSRLRNSLRSRASSVKGKFKKHFEEAATPPIELRTSGKINNNDLNTYETSNLKQSDHIPKTYPAIPRYP